MTVSPPVLVTDGSVSGQSRSALAAVRALASVGYRVAIARVGTHSLAASSRSCSAAIDVPPADEAGFASAVRALAVELGAEVVLPAGDADLLALGHPGQDLVDKERLALRAEAAGLATLKGKVFADGAELAAAADTLPFPAVVKQVLKKEARPHQAMVLQGPTALVHWQEETSPVVVEPFVDEPMTAVFGLIWQGRLVALGAQRYLRTWPSRAGVSCAAVTCPMPEGISEGAILKLLHGYDGIFQIQFVGSHVVDVNPRVYGSLPLAVQAGVNLPDLWCRILAGESVDTHRARHGVWYRWIEGEARWAWHALRHGDFRGVASVLRPRPGSAHSVWSLRDPSPLFRRFAYALRGSHPTPGLEAPAAPEHDVATRLGLTEREYGLLTRLPETEHEAHGVPTLSMVERREQAQRLVGAIIGPTQHQSVLPTTWSGDIDVSPLPEDAFPPNILPMDSLLAHLGSPARDQWLVHENGRGLARLDMAADPSSDSLAKVLDRCRRNRGVRFREVVELRRMQAAGVDLPDHQVIAEAARLEAMLGGALLQGNARGHLLARWWLRNRPRRWRRPRAYVVAFSGLDGAGKSTQVRKLSESLMAAGLQVGVVWARPGMHLALLRQVRRAVKRVLGMSPEPGTRAMGRGDPTPPRSRRGLVGVGWRTLVILSYTWSAWKPRLLRRGVVIYDRHVLDAVATLRAVYLASASGRLVRIMSWLLPRAQVSILLDVSPEVAATRKPDEVFNRRLLDSQHEVYRSHRTLMPGLTVIDGTKDSVSIAGQVLHQVLSGGAPSAQGPVPHG